MCHKAEQRSGACGRCASRRAGTAGADAAPVPAWHPSAGVEQHRVPPSGGLTPRDCCPAAPQLAPWVPVGVHGSCGAAPRAPARLRSGARVRRYGFVTFERKDDAQRALAMCRQNQFLVGASPMPALVELARIEARRCPPPEVSPRLCVMRGFVIQRKACVFLAGNRRSACAVGSWCCCRRTRATGG